MNRLLRALCLFLIACPAWADDDLPVKRSGNGIWHAQGSNYYAQTQKFESFKTMDG